jgi:hypothetical protein
MSSYIDHCAGPAEGLHPATVTHDWRKHTFRALTWQYGLERAHKIRSGRDPATQADLEAWNRLGRRAAA